MLQNLEESTCARASFLIKKDSGTGAFRWILRNFKEHVFYRTAIDDCFW